MRSTILLLLVLVCGCASSASGAAVAYSASQNPAARPSPESNALEVQRAIDKLSSANSDERVGAAEYLATQGQQAKRAIPQLSKLLHETDLACTAAVRALATIGPEAVSALPDIVKAARKQLLSSSDPPSVCWGVAEGAVPAMGQVAVPKLLLELGTDPATDEVGREHAAGSRSDCHPKGRHSSRSWRKQECFRREHPATFWKGSGTGVASTGKSCAREDTLRWNVCRNRRGYWRRGSQSNGRIAKNRSASEGRSASPGCQPSAPDSQILVSPAGSRAPTRVGEGR